MPVQTMISRRAVIRTMLGAGGGMILGFHIPDALAAAVAPQPWTTPTHGVEINAWLTIDGDGTVTIRVPHTEQGQGGLTSVAMLIAEELDVPWKSIQVVFADMHRHVNEGEEYIETSTHGSQLVRDQHPHIMQAGASARERLKQAAAEAWGIERGAIAITARQGVLSAGDRRASYAEFAAAAAEITLDKEPAIKTPDEWWLLGRPIPRLDARVKVDGSARFSIDARPEGLVYAAVKCCPVPWGRLVGYDFERVADRRGIVGAVELRALPGCRDNSDLQDGVAIVADSWHRAKAALDDLPIEWDFGPEGEVSSATQAARARELLDAPGEVSHASGGDALAVIGASQRVVSADYHRPYEAHARMEPINATVSVTRERVDVWSPTQDQSTALLLAADQLGRDTRDVYVHTTFIGGAFGGNGGGATAVTRQAAEISRRTGRPVQVIWPREEDIVQDKQRAPVYARLTAALGETGLPEALLSRSVVFTRDALSIRLADRGVSDMPYACRTGATSGTPRRRTFRRRRIARPARTRTASWSSSSRTRWRWPAAGIRSSGDSR